MEAVLQKALVLLHALIVMEQVKLECNKVFFLFNKHVQYAQELDKSLKTNVRPAEELAQLKRIKLYL